MLAAQPGIHVCKRFRSCRALTGVRFLMATAEKNHGKGRGTGLLSAVASRLGACACRLLMLGMLAAWTSPSAWADGQAFSGHRGKVPEDVAARMRRHSWREGCPVPIAKLSYLRLSYVGYDGAVHQGELVVHEELADEVLRIFKALFEARLSIEKMRLIDDYGGDDDASMADNNTSGFNCRFVLGKPGVYSKHAHGRAVDINPRTNPMVAAGAVYPPAGAAFLDRKGNAPGLLRADGKAVQAFKRRGWVWGADWATIKDYQHFEK